MSSKIKYEDFVGACKRGSGEQPEQEGEEELQELQEQQEQQGHQGHQQQEQKRKAQGESGPKEEQEVGSSSVLQQQRKPERSPQCWAPQKG